MHLLRTLLNFIAWPLRILLFLLLAILASLNLHESTVFLFLGHQWRAPMVVLLLIAFVAGVVLGVIALTLRRASKPAQVLAPVQMDSLNAKTPVGQASLGPASISAASYEAASVLPQSRL